LSGQTISFRQLLSEQGSKIEVIVTLLAVLELIKRRVVTVEQPSQFGNLIINYSDTAPELTETEWEELTGLTEVS
jgi:segregation and condensation protein A